MVDGFSDGLFWVRGTLSATGSHVWRGPYPNLEAARIRAASLWPIYNIDTSGFDKTVVRPNTANAMALIEIGTRSWRAWDTYRRPVGRWFLHTEDSITEETAEAFAQVVTDDQMTLLINADTTPDNAACFGAFDEDFCDPCEDQAYEIGLLPPFFGQNAVQNFRFANGFAVRQDTDKYDAVEEWANGGFTTVLFDSFLPAYNPDGNQPYGRYLDNVRVQVSLGAELTGGPWEPLPEDAGGAWTNSPGFIGGLGYSTIPGRQAFPSDRFNPAAWRLLLSYRDDPFNSGRHYYGATDPRHYGVGFPLRPGVPLDFLGLGSKVPIYNGLKTYPVQPGATSAVVGAFIDSRVPFLSEYAGVKAWKVSADFILTWDVVDAGGPVECHTRSSWFSRRKTVYAESPQDIRPEYSTFPWDAGYFGGVDNGAGVTPPPQRYTFDLSEQPESEITYKDGCLTYTPKFLPASVITACAPSWKEGKGGSIGIKTQGATPPAWMEPVYGDGSLNLGISLGSTEKGLPDYTVDFGGDDTGIPNLSISSALKGEWNNVFVPEGEY